MTTVQRVARTSGWALVVLAIWGAFVAGVTMEPNPAYAHRLWGLFPVNFPHNLVHLAFGLWGLTAGQTPDRARTFTLTAGVFFVALAALGFVAPTAFGIMPIGGNDIGLHALIGIALLLAWIVTRSMPAGPGSDRAP